MKLHHDEIIQSDQAAVAKYRQEAEDRAASMKLHHDEIVASDKAAVAMYMQQAQARANGGNTPPGN